MIVYVRCEAFPEKEPLGFLFEVESVIRCLDIVVESVIRCLDIVVVLFLFVFTGPVFFFSASEFFL